MYGTVKLVHVTCATLSGVGFLFRGALMLADSRLLGQRWLRVVPHINDSLLLAAAVALVLMLGQYPFVDSWLTAKVLGLLVYIGLGMVALGKRYGKAVRGVCWFAAILVFSYIVSVAINKNPLGPLATLSAFVSTECITLPCNG